ncbi:PREDICTED: gamma-tubulin complex component 6 [Acromyrmex echinatior]|uniref:Gamma-tubulin complex component 6 n=1 Tax=Acromyrmex echinatior TaxID=103372 RepID=F4WXC2_ACREC|nr:PREDICTED: gamma-tubulin complex component 6 [Acromyrmex echinatior]EGI61171.1 Gamma-tubulin complex component 6 [Acromyrmex echinatior]
MDLERGDANIYELITQLIRHTLQRNRSENGSSYMPPKSDVKIVKDFRSKAYEILLNKSNKTYNQGNAVNSDIDPLVEILKHAFVLRLALKRVSEAKKLESLISELYSEEDITDTVIYTLQLLIELKNFQTDTGTALDVFHYGKINPFLPEDVTSTNGVPMFQTYPMESFILPEKFEAMLGIRRTCTRQDTATNFVNRVSFEDECASKAILGVQTIRYNNTIEMSPCISSCTENTAKQCNILAPFSTHIMVEQTNKIYLSTPRFMSNMTLPCEWIKSVDNQIQNRFCAVSSEKSDRSFTNESKKVATNIDLIWKEILFSDDCVSKLRTWESLGAPEFSKQSLFVTDLPETALHLARIRQTSILSLLPKKVMNSISLMSEVSSEKFLSDIKLLLFGIDSDSFKYDTVTGFKLEENITVHGISFKSLKMTCQEAISWGNSFKCLSRLVMPDPQTGKLQQHGLIFKAMCANIKELLLYYRSALQRVLNRHKFPGLLSLLKQIHPLARLIVEVARLCGCSTNQYILGGGSGILTHIYKEVTKVTNPKIALVFYSILKSCCEVYFRLLQNWLFEGTCDDIYGEFMIQARSHYLRKRGRKFWTESFTIDTESVPGFLSELSESILQCGKTLRLLKICSPKNPVCNVSLNAQPEVRVCLSVSMLREQLLRCQEYEHKGEAALGPIVSLLSAIQDEKKAERETAELVIRAQQETLLRLDKQRKELSMKAAQSKRELLQELKQQAEASALIKEKEKENEMLADKLLLEKLNREQEEMREQQQAEKENLVNYYDKLTADIESNRARSIWRQARMSHFEKRVEFLKSVKKLDIEMSENATTLSSDENIVVDIDEQNKNTSEAEVVSSQDENSNFEENGLLDVTATDISDQNNPKNLLNVECSDVSPVENCEPDKNIASDEKITIEDSPITADTQNVHLPQETPSLNYKVYKKNNEKSDLQDFLRDEAMKNIHTIINGDDKTSTLNTRLNNILEANEVTERIIGAINRPKSLAINRIDNMTVAQTNKLKVLMQEYGMTPNNNEFSTILTNNQRFIDHTNINGNNQILIDITSESSSNNTKENMNNNVLSTTNIRLPAETMNIHGPMNNEEYSNKVNNTNNEINEPIMNNMQQNNIDTPMSCTTDNFTTASIHTPLSQIPNSDDIFALNAGQEVSSLSDDMTKSITEETFESPMSCNFKLPNLFGVSSDVKSSTAPSSLTIADVEMIDHTSLKVYLEKSIIIPLQIQTRLVNNAIIKYLVNEHNMLSHLHSLRSYFFLLNGEFAKSLTDSLYSRLYTISAPIELFNSATLTNLLEKALMNSFSNNYAHAELLSLSAVDKPCQLYISDPNVLECLCLNYKIAWPLNIILDDMMMLQYSKVFKFLIMIGRMSWVLQEDFNIMKVERNAVNSEQYHKLQLYRHSMTQFMNALRNYLTCSVLHASWNEFEKDLQNSRTIDQIYLSHMNYIKRILSRCMLNTRGEKMRVCLINIFKIILKFHNRLRSQAWTVDITDRYSHPNFKSLEQMYQSFCEWRTYMAHVAHKLATSGYQPHLTHFLNALNINDMYDLTTKQQ